MCLTYHRLPWILRYRQPSQREFKAFPGRKDWTYRRWPSTNTSASPSRDCGRGRRGSSRGCSGWRRGGGNRRLGSSPLSHIAADIVPFAIWEARRQQLRNILQNWSSQPYLMWLAVWSRAPKTPATVPMRDSLLALSVESFVKQVRRSPKE